MEITKLAQRYPQSIVGLAYRFAKRAHAGQKRMSGEPYFYHVLATAETLHEWHMDEVVVAAGLLHDTIEDTSVTQEEVKKEFGDEIAFLIEGVTKLGHVKYRGAHNKAENLRKMLLAMSKDLRVIFIKLADRRHNMQTLYALPSQKQKRIALETDEIYASLAYRLGMQHMSGELRDLAFPYLHPKESRWLQETVKDVYEKREAYLKRTTPLLKKTLADRGLTPLTIDYRAKRYSSLFQKLLKHDMNIDRIYDLVALRLIMKSVSDCYATLGVIHHLWPPLPGRIKDYIAVPKPNGYRSLHTTVIGPEEKPIEIQIKTMEMHEENENGIAAHWLYKEKRGAPKHRAEEFGKEIKLIQQLRSWQETFANPESNPADLLQSMKIDFFKDRIFVITPRGDVIDLPAGATPIDFAYHIHSEIGDECVGAKINDQFVSLNHELSSGDVVFILRQKNKRPSEDWLSFVKTAAARDHIRAALKSKQRGLPHRAPTMSELRIVIKDRVGLMKDIFAAIARTHIKIIHVVTNTSPGSAYTVVKVQCNTTDKKKLEKLILKVKNVSEVKEISYRLL